MLFCLSAVSNCELYLNWLCYFMYYRVSHFFDPKLRSYDFLKVPDGTQRVFFFFFFWLRCHLKNHFGLPKETFSEQNEQFFPHYNLLCNEKFHWHWKFFMVPYANQELLFLWVYLKVHIIGFSFIGENEIASQILNLCSWIVRKPFKDCCKLVWYSIFSIFTWNFSITWRSQSGAEHQMIKKLLCLVCLCVCVCVRNMQLKQTFLFQVSLFILILCFI